MAGTTFVLHAQLLSIEKAGLIAWPDPTEEQIVVGSDSPTGPVWSPWPEPIFKRFGQMCMAVPTVATQQFFKTVPGRQFADCFSDCSGPFTNRGPWMPLLNEEGEEWLVTNGVFRLNAFYTTPVIHNGFLLLPLGTNLHLRDFYTSVDILDWTASTTNTSTTNAIYFALTGRGVILNGYIAGVILNYDNIPGNVMLSIWDGAADVRGTNFDGAAYPPPYRLEFSGVGYNLRLAVLNRTTGALIREQKLYRTRFTEGFVGVWISRRNDPGNTYAITADNFFVTGTKP